MKNTDTLVLGAGLAGLTVARHLTGQSQKVTLIEKANAAGGRLATRRSDFGSVDHGAQYITSRTPDFTALINQLAQSGELAAWRPKGKDSSRPWWVGQPGMAALGKALAKDLDISFNTRATRIEKQGDRYQVHTQSGDGAGAVYSASRVIAAIPAPQALDLFGSVDQAFQPLQHVRMAPCWTAMMAFEAPLPTVPDFARGQEGGTLSLIARNGSKPERVGENFVLHATPQWSRAQLESDPETVKAAMIKAMRIETGLGADLPRPAHFEVHRWLYALVETPLGQPYLGNTDNTLFTCGDWCLDGRAEAAHHSALALARHIISL
jgi:renalase